MPALASATSLGRLPWPRTPALTQFHSEPRPDERHAVQTPDTDKPFFAKRTEPTRAALSFIPQLARGDILVGKGRTRTSAANFAVMHNTALLRGEDTLVGAAQPSVKPMSRSRLGGSGGLLYYRLAWNNTHEHLRNIRAD